MTELMVLIYFAGIVEVLQVFSTLASVLTLLALFFIFMVSSGQFDENKSFEDQCSSYKLYKGYQKNATRFLAVFAIIAIFTPNKETLYGIAALNATSDVVATLQKSDMGKKAYDALDGYLDKLIEENKKKKK
jgi:high-affinity Fe2+/Pb2+ permease